MNPDTTQEASQYCQLLCTSSLLWYVSNNDSFSRRTYSPATQILQTSAAPSSSKIIQLSDLFVLIKRSSGCNESIAKTNTVQYLLVEIPLFIRFPLRSFSFGNFLSLSFNSRIFFFQICGSGFFFSGFSPDLLRFYMNLNAVRFFFFFFHANVICGFVLMFVVSLEDWCCLCVYHFMRKPNLCLCI